MRRLKAHLGGIRFRVLLLGVVPLLVSVAMLGTHLISARLGDAREALAEHGRVITRNLSLASEYSLFAGDREALSAIVSRLVEQQRNVLWVAILDRKRQEVVHKGPLPGGFPDHVLLSQPGSGFPTVFEEPIGSAVSMMPDPGGLLEPAEAPQAPGALAPLGWAMVGLSLDGYVKRERLIIVTALALIAAGLAVSVLMALSLGGGIIRPLRRLAGHVEQVRRGEPGVRVQQLSSGDMGRLEAGFNQMAEELDGVQAKLRRQVEDATSRLQRTVAELRYSNKELAHAKERALEAGREKTEFLARMSHEIRTPLNAVIGFARLLNDNHSSWSAREYTQTINQAANQLLYVIDDILNFTRLEAGNLELESIPFDIRSCLEDVVAMISPTAHDKELELALLVHSDVPAHIVGDPTRISQILLNMGNNAVKFTARGQVFIELERAAPEDDSGVEQLRFTVTDSGPGLTPEARGRLFEPFSQGDSTVSRHFGGTGLGLAIAHRLVQLMDGRIGVESEAGEGAQFWFQVPLRAAQAGPGFQPPAEFRNHAVVVVEPEPLTQRALRATLAGWGMQVFNTRDPAGLPDILRAAASAGSGNPLVLVGLAGNERRAGEAVAAYGIVRRSFSGPVLFLVGADR
ncbi:MAG: ATP-binding protein, partial [Pseudomonadota bacterium]